MDIAVYWTHVHKLRFCTPVPGGYFGSNEWIDGREPRQFVFRVAATACQLSVVAKIWTDESKRLHFELLDHMN
ncbi:hypothetical protein DIE18_14575 [Burkholderia sp. Bp9125]|nr:hypothetical protein DIE18_14575 [Burkholderia sp. Bp9125]